MRRSFSLPTDAPGRVKCRSEIRRRSMPFGGQQSSANAPTPLAETAIGNAQIPLARLKRANGKCDSLRCIRHSSVSKVGAADSARATAGYTAARAMLFQRNASPLCAGCAFEWRSGARGTRQPGHSQVLICRHAGESRSSGRLTKAPRPWSNIQVEQPRPVAENAGPATIERPAKAFRTLREGAARQHALVAGAWSRRCPGGEPGSSSLSKAGDRARSPQRRSRRCRSSQARRHRWAAGRTAQAQAEADDRAQ